MLSHSVVGPCPNVVFACWWQQQTVQAAIVPQGRRTRCQDMMDDLSHYNNNLETGKGGK